MKSLRKLMAVAALAFALSVSVLAGDIQTPGNTNPPPPPTAQSTIQDLLVRLLTSFLT